MIGVGGCRKWDEKERMVGSMMLREMHGVVEVPRV